MYYFPEKFLKFLFIIFSFGLNATGKSNANTNSEEYGKGWIYFPDGDGTPHFVNLSDSASTSSSVKTEPEIEFRFYSKQNLENYIILDELAMLADLTIGEILYNTEIKIITHGWMSNADKSAVMNIKNAYFKAQNDINVVAVDWSAYAMNYYYMSVASQTRAVGEKIAFFLNSLHRQYNISGDQIHLIGHSLGAHVMGIAGFESEIEIGRITGLDPALPMFGNIQNEKIRLDYADAKFVDVIHTCGGVLGFWDAIGKADFYPNNGKAPQPGCNFQNMFQLDACSHGRSHIYFAESIINANAFPSYQCKSWRNDLEKVCPQVGFMGEHADWNMSVPLVLHGFPNPETDRERFNIWLMAVGGDIIGLEIDHIYKYRRVCRIHFETKFLCRNNRISNIAVPTLHLPEPTAPTNTPVAVEQVQELPSSK